MQYYLSFPYERNWIPSFFAFPSTVHTNGSRCFQAKNKRTGQDVALKAMCKWVNSDVAYHVRDLEDDFQNSKRKIWCRNKTKNMLILKGKTENRISDSSSSWYERHNRLHLKTPEGTSPILQHQPKRSKKCSRTFVATVGAATKHVCDDSRDRIQDEQMLRNEISIHKAKKPIVSKCHGLGWIAR